MARAAGKLIEFSTRSSAASAAYGRHATRAAFIFLVLFFAYGIYDAVYPSDDLYLHEFEAVTAQKAPMETKILAKHAAYPDFHGDYCSFSRMAISAASSRRLLQELATDKRFIRFPYKGSSVGSLPSQPLEPLQVLAAFARSDMKPDESRSILFLGNGTRVEVNICYT